MKKKILLIASLFLYSSISYAQSVESILEQYLKNSLFRYIKSDLFNYRIDNRDLSKSLKGEVVKIQQIYNHLPVFNAVSTALIKENKVTYFLDAFEKDYKKADDVHPSLKPSQAFKRLQEAMGLKENENYIIVDFLENDLDKTKLITKQRLVYFKTNDNLELCYEFLLPVKDKFDYWDVLVSAHTGWLIHKSSLVSYCAISSDIHQESEDSLIFPQKKDFYGLTNNYLDNTLVLADNASYNIFELPVESPNFGTRNTVFNPWILSSSPHGWHFDGTDHYTRTQGNNVRAGVLDMNNFVFTYADGGSTRSFDFPFNDNVSTNDNLNASISNLFYGLNKAHDIFYYFGFTETARNFQKNNFGHGGISNDAMTGSIIPIAINNASFTNHPDGTSGEILVGLWKQHQFLYYNNPEIGQLRKVRSERATFGPTLTPTGVTGEVIQAVIDNGCMNLPLGSLTNKIGIVKSGSCSDIIKVKNIQNAGAVAAIIYETSASSNINFISGNDTSITIPSVKILNSEGEYIKGLLNSGTSIDVTLKSEPLLTKDKNLAFDNFVVLHEYAHGLSNRLTGTGYSCLDETISAEQMGEGWSDFYGLMLTNRPEYNSVTTRGVLTYPMNESSTGIGYRLTKYATDFSVNNYTYGKTNGMTQDIGGAVSADEHKVGFVWATMLWDLHWKYADKYGYSSNVLINMNNGSTKVIQLVTDALKLQACNPSFIEARDAILAAEMNLTSGENRCMIWEVFTKRGLGINASSGNKADINDQIEDFTMPSDCNTLATTEMNTKKNIISIYPNPAKDEFYINFANPINGRVSIEIYDISGKLISSENKAPAENKSAISTDKLTTGTYIVKVKGLGIETTSKLMVNK